MIISGLPDNPTGKARFNKAGLYNMKTRLLTLFTLIICSIQLHAAETYASKGILRVCADPFMLPFSNAEGQGFENRISELLAEKLGMELEYEFFPQRMGFIRNTLKSEEGGLYKCDLVINVPESFELAATTDPYYTTTYMLAYVKGGKLDGLEKPEDLRNMVESGSIDLNFGVTERGPAQLWLFYNELLQYMTPYQGQPGNPKYHPGQKLMEDLAAGKIDATIVWGPTAGYYADKFKDQAEIILLPVKDSEENAEARYTYSMSMAVRYGEKEWKDRINKVVQENKAEIHRILEDFGVPLINK